MKSAYELALDRSGGLLRKISPEVKEKLAYLDRKCMAKLAKTELMVHQRMEKETNQEKRTQMEEALPVKLASIRDRFELQKGEIRNSCLFEFPCKLSLLIRRARPVRYRISTISEHQLMHR